MAKAGPPLFIQLLATFLIGIINGIAWLFAELYLLSLLGQVALLFLAWQLPGRRTICFCWLSATLSLGIAFHWAPAAIASTTNLSGPWPYLVFIILIAWEAIVFAGWCGSVAWLKGFHPESLWLAPFTWVIFEYFWPRVFTWALAHSHSQLQPVLQIAEIGGTSAVSATIVLAACALFSIIKSNIFNFRYILTAVFFLCLVLIYGVVRIEQVESQISAAPKLRVAAIQVDPTFADSIAKLQLASLSLDQQVQLIVWPETSIGHYEESLRHFRDNVSVCELSEAPNPAEDPSAGLSHAFLLAGGKAYAQGTRNCGPYLNTAFLISPAKEIVGRYAKRSLMPIGEYMPLGEQLPALNRWAAVTTPLLPGQSDDPIKLPLGPRIGTLICYEDMERDNARRTALCGAECFVVLINGSGFEDEDALRQHQRLAMLRTIENRRGMLRCGATGVTCYISPTGDIEQELPVFQEGQLAVDMPLSNQITLYTRCGEWFIWLSVIIVTATIGILIRRSRTLAQ